ncbi:hypothetical protein BD408DRAFT_422126 [Parasitella parasitica]|nr:hypothetical protein BD408DRAFT_422126 [Parasitella parasitica]
MAWFLPITISSKSLSICYCLRQRQKKILESRPKRTGKLHRLPFTSAGILIQCAFSRIINHRSSKALCIQLFQEICSHYRSTARL